MEVEAAGEDRFATAPSGGKMVKKFLTQKGMDGCNPMHVELALSYRLTRKMILTHARDGLALSVMLIS